MGISEWRKLRAARKHGSAYFGRMQVLLQLRKRAIFYAKYPGEPLPGDREAWEVQAVTVFTDAFGQRHFLNEDLDDLINSKTPDGQNSLYYRGKYWRKARGIIDSAIASYNFMHTPFRDSGVANVLDSELMARVDHVFQMNDWTAVASLAATFVEDRFRTWAGLDNTSFGVNLMTKVLHPETGILPLGISPGESEGWHQLGRGFMSSCSNVDRHRIQSRDDLQRYAVGVLGTASLLLTQMHNQHAESFRNT
jgi:hypothetical protein